VKNIRKMKLSALENILLSIISFLMVIQISSKSEKTVSERFTLAESKVYNVLSYEYTLKIYTTDYTNVNVTIYDFNGNIDPNHRYINVRNVDVVIRPDNEVSTIVISRLPSKHYRDATVEVNISRDINSNERILMSFISTTILAIVTIFVIQFRNDESSNVRNIESTYVTTRSPCEVRESIRLRNEALLFRRRQEMRKLEIRRSINRSWNNMVKDRMYSSIFGQEVVLDD
jgi:hypothetical protein